MRRENYFISVNLSKIPDARRTYDTNPYTHEEEEGLFIPASSLRETPNKSFILWLLAAAYNTPVREKTHAINFFFDKQQLEEMKEKGVSTIRGIGNMRVQK